MTVTFRHCLWGRQTMSGDSVERVERVIEILRQYNWTQAGQSNTDMRHVHAIQSPRARVDLLFSREVRYHLPGSEWYAMINTSTITFFRRDGADHDRHIVGILRTTQIVFWLGYIAGLTASGERVEGTNSP
jgi:hypothetical protein